MSESDASHVYFSEGDDPEMRRAEERARESFRYFWREVISDRNRIVPALGLAAVKAPFSDDDEATDDGEPRVEFMWIDDVDFDGECVHGMLINEPNWLTSVEQGDEVSIPLAQICDWLYSMDDVAFGGFTVNLMRSRMTPRERAEHDDAWGLDFGDPSQPRVSAYHDAAEADAHTDDDLASLLKDELRKNPSLAQSQGHLGWTLLHQQASVGHLACVKLLLDAGADPTIRTENGRTALDLAMLLNWPDVVELLTNASSRRS